MRQDSYTYEQLLECGHGQLFGPNGPRLPLPNMLMFDRISRINDEAGTYGKGEVVAELDVRPDLWFFGCHFEGDPVMPGCLGLDALWQMVGFYLGWQGHPGKGRALGVGEVKFKGQVLPTAGCVTYHVHIRRVMALKLAMAQADGEISVDDRVIYTASGLKVGLFTSTEGF